MGVEWVNPWPRVLHLLNKAKDLIMSAHSCHKLKAINDKSNLASQLEFSCDCIDKSEQGLSRINVISKEAIARGGLFSSWS